MNLEEWNKGTINPETTLLKTIIQRSNVFKLQSYKIKVLPEILWVKSVLSYS